MVEHLPVAKTSEKAACAGSIIYLVYSTWTTESNAAGSAWLKGSGFLSVLILRVLANGLTEIVLWL